MPALSPTMEEGTISKWFVKAGDKVASGDMLAEIETDKATMEFEAVDEGTIADIAIPEGTDGVKVGTVIALLAEGEDVSAPKEKSPARKQKATEPETGHAPKPESATPAKAESAAQRPDEHSVGKKGGSK